MKVRHLLVYCYFCPDCRHRAGGVQQIAGPLLYGLTKYGNWEVTVAHVGLCNAPDHHEIVEDPFKNNANGELEPESLQRLTSQLQTLSKEADVILCIDRVVPLNPKVPAVLMSNTAAYSAEAFALLSNCWSCVIVPSEHFRRCVLAINPTLNVQVIPYGLDQSIVNHITNLPRPKSNCSTVIARLPHRPDRRKGHDVAIEGLALHPPTDLSIHLEIAWLPETRYESFRQELVDLIKSHRLEDKVSFVNWLNEDERWEALSRTHAVLQLGVFEETFGLGVVVAVISGRLAITTAQPAVREVLRGSSLHMELDDGYRWCIALERGLSVFQKTEKEREHHQIIEGLSLERMVAAYEKIFEIVLQRKGND